MSQISPEQIFRQAPDGRTYLRIPQSPLRRHIDKRLDSTGTVSYGSAITVLEKGDPEHECSAFIFDHVMGEPWGKETKYFTDNPGLWINTSAFLEEAGYHPVKGTPKPGDIVVYGESITPVVASHFGVMDAFNWVRSKFTHNPVFGHRIDAIPTYYGDFATFFRKVKAAG